MKTIGHIRMQIGDALILSNAYRALQAAVDAGALAVTESGLCRLRHIVDEVHSLSAQEYDLSARSYPSDVWNVAL